MATTVTLIEGDGIGPEITASVKRIFAAAGVPIQWEEENAGQTTLESVGELIPASLIESIKKNKVALKGPLTTPVGKGFKSVNVQLRQLFDLYQNVRPCVTTEGISSRFTDVNMVIFRENTEGLYAGLEFFDERLQIADSISRVTKDGCYRIVKAAFDYARRRGCKKVTLVHKANILKNAGRLMLQAGETVAKEFPGITYENVIVDNMCMQLVLKPQQFDVVVTTNLFGDILSDLCAGLVGGLGVVAGANIGDEVAIFEAVHGTAPDIAGQGKANPTALLRSAIMMLYHLDMVDDAKRINHAIDETLKIKEQCTGDLGGSATTQQFTDYVIQKLQN
ncbi:isocitrate dehydrogenase (NAD(+)) [Flammeovirgaceae bacterium 311]|nr:isocitrate dehydrogenase (NAD(+)) [Flammeovirgaceae bacterium 311]